MTDLPVEADNLPGRLGATARLEGDELVLGLAPVPTVLRCGVVRASVLSYLVDCVAGIPLQRSDAWTLTTDMSVRALAVPAPASISARFTMLRQGRRTASGRVALVDDRTGQVVGDGAIGFASVSPRPGDPPIPTRSARELVELFGSLPPVAEPLRDAAGIDVVDRPRGTVQVELAPRLLNPVGTLQGAMTALVGEVAAEECLSARSAEPVVVTDLDIRYLARTTAGPVRTSTQLLGEGADAAAIVELVDLSTDTIVALVHARGKVVGTHR